MLYPVKIIDIELADPISPVEGLENYMSLQCLVRLNGSPLGYIYLPVSAGCVGARAIKEEIIDKHNYVIMDRLLQNGLAGENKTKELVLEDLFELKSPRSLATWPFISVAVCTRNRTADLALCLDAISKLNYPNFEILVIDNAPSDDSTEKLIQTQFPNVRYIKEPRPGLDWARNRAIVSAKGEIIAYTDDDVIVDTEWLKAFAFLFAENPEVMAVTGLVVPFELETRAQVLFEMYGGFGRGFERKWHRFNSDSLPWTALGTGQHGTGANMAYRKSVFDQAGQFDPALDVGTVTNGGGDLEMFFRVLKEGHTLVYEPAAMVRHRHRREYAQLREQLANNSKGLLAYFRRSIIAYPNQRRAFFRLWLWWVRNWNLNRLTKTYFKPTGFPRDLVLAELKGCFSGFNLYKKAHQRAVEISAKYGNDPAADIVKPVPKIKLVNKNKEAGIGIFSVDLSKEIKAFTDIGNYAKVRYYLDWNGLSLGFVDIENQYMNVSASRFIQVVVSWLGLKLLHPSLNIKKSIQWSQAMAALHNRFDLKKTETHYCDQLSPEIAVSVIVATFDRPDDLKRCLQHLVNQQSSRQIEIIVVDNHPASGLTSPVVEQFPGVILINETKQGLSFARNAGICAGKGTIMLSTDDDVVVPPDWVENLVAPFTRPEVMVVTGNVLPLELSTPSQQLFEEYGGLGRGFQKYEVNGQWFESFKRRAVPTWQLGACANAAFRTSIFSHPDIGLINEKLGAGTPTGCSEDTYLFYKVLKAGYTLLYEPKSYVWHGHRKSMAALQRQLYNYSKGHVAYHLETWMKDNDWRGLTRIFIELPKAQIKRLFSSLFGNSTFPASMILYEIAGSIAGPWALLNSSLRVKRLGRTASFPGSEKKFTAEGKGNLLFKIKDSEIAG